MDVNSLEMVRRAKKCWVHLPGGSSGHFPGNINFFFTFLGKLGFLATVPGFVTLFRLFFARDLLKFSVIENPR